MIFSPGVPAPQSETGTVNDIDGNIYKTIQIGDRWWMAENLRVTHGPEGNPIQSWFYQDNEQKYGKYGRLYTWDTAVNGSEEEGARGIAPEGWHIPSLAEWEELIAVLGGIDKVGQAIKVGGSTGFEAHLGGGADFRSNYVYFGKYAMFWASTASNEQRAYHVGIDDNGKWDAFAAMKGARIHIRCIKDKPGR